MKQLFVVIIILILLLGGVSCSTPPSITNVYVSSQDITETTAIITWTTDKLATSQVEYGEATTYGSTTPLDENMVIYRSVTLTGLESGTTYHFRVKSRDSSGNEAVSEDNIFATLETTAPTISEIDVSGITESDATITWTTDKPATSQVEYGEATAYGSSTTIDENLGTSHTVTLNGLEPDTTYHFRVKSKDSSDNEAVSEDHDFKTKPCG